MQVPMLSFKSVSKVRTNATSSQNNVIVLKLYITPDSITSMAIFGSFSGLATN